MGEFRPLVSCVVPIYNAARYLDQGITSLLHQTYDNLEIILVDDCSSDDSFAICEHYAKQDTRVRAFRNSENAGGPLQGRARGITEATGDWITFMDGDDYVLPEYIEHLVAATDKGRFDVAVTGYARLFPDGHHEDFAWSDYQQTTSERLATFYEHFLKHDFWTDPTDTVGQNLVRATVCKSVDLAQYPNLTYAEDTLMALAFAAASTKGVNFVDHHDFMWRQVEGSGSHGGFSNRADQPAFYTACYEIFHRTDIYPQVSSAAPLVSMVVPVYNTADYLAECLDSLLAQSYRNLEIIVVNDGATDGSQSIIDSYAGRVIAIKQANQGLNMARAAGSKAAHGDYLAYVDSDDTVHPDYIKILYENLLENDVDISVVGLHEFSRTSDIKTLGTGDLLRSQQVLKGRHDALRYYLSDITSLPHVHQMTAWGKLYKKAMIDATDWQFGNYRRHEDNFETLQWYAAAKNGVAVLPVELYNYRKNPQSITQILQPNVAPDGRSLNYFEFIAELYQKTKDYIADPSLDAAILQQFADTNRQQVERFFASGQLDAANLAMASANWVMILGVLNGQLAAKDEQIGRQAATIQAMDSSTSWRLTRPLRKAKKLLKDGGK